MEPPFSGALGAYQPQIDPAQLLRPITAGFDLRYSGYKMAPVDANLFPAGWHQICEQSQPIAQNRLRAWLDQYASGCDSLVLYIEPFTRNAAYLENAWILHSICAGTVKEVRVAMPLDALPDQGYSFQTVHGKLHVYRFGVDAHGKPLLGGTICDCPIFLNSDLSSGPGSLLDLSVPIFPDPRQGWYQRSKEDFFDHWDQVAHEWSDESGVDYWHLSMLNEVHEFEDFRTAREEGLADAVRDMLQRISEDYKQHEIHDHPFVVLKSASGTFGRGVLVFSTVEEMMAVPGKVAKNLTVGQGGRSINRFLLQEGVYTREIVRNCPSEPVVYAMGGAVVGGFYRSHCGRDLATSLNAPGMVFASMCVAEHENNSTCHFDPEGQSLYYETGRRALMALDREIQTV